MAHADDIDALAMAATARFKSDVARVLARLRSYLVEVLAKASTERGLLKEDAFNAELAAKLGKGYAATLRQLGYDDALATLLDGFERIVEANAGFISDELGASFSSPNLRSLARLAQGSMDDLIDRAGAAGPRLREIVLVGAHTNAPIADLVEKLAQAASVTLQQAVVEAQTQLMAFHRDGLATEAQAAGIDLYTYDGPEDAITRPFCDPLVGKIVTLQDLDDMENGKGQPKPVSRFLGGYRCRHSLSPISLEEAQALYAAQGRRAVGPGCTLAMRIVTGRVEGPAHAAFVQRYAGEVRRGRVVRRRLA